MKNRIHNILTTLLISLSVLSLSCNIATNTDQKKEQITDLSVVEDTVEIKNEKTEIEIYLEKEGLINIHSLAPSIKVDLKYSTTDNFTKTILYDNLREAYLHPLAAQKLANAQQLLKEINPDYSLLVYDAARPMSVQKKMYAVVQNTKYHSYVANPSRTGMHNYGMAVDITICNNNGTPLDMGTPFDYFGKAAGINQENELMNQGVLTKQQVENRKLLRKVMTEAGFITIRGEWWHFNALSLAEAKKITQVIE